MAAVELENVTKVFVARARKGMRFDMADYPSSFVTALLYRLYGRALQHAALKGVSLKVERGEFFGLLGPNGSGKTTLLRIVAGLTPPTSGSVRIFGRDVRGLRVHEYVTYVPGALAGGAWVSMALSAYENLVARARLLGVPERRVREVLDLMGLSEHAHKPVGTFSSGMVARLEVAAALLKDAPIVLLDEPTAGFSPEVELAFHEHLREAARAEGKTLIYATHYLHFAERFFDRVAVMKEGKVVAVGSPSELKAKLGSSSTVSAKVLPRGPVEGLAERLRAELEGVEGVAVRQLDEHFWEVRVVCRDAEEAITRLVPALVRANTLVRRIDVREPTLEDLYLSLIYGEMHEAA
jgi:ABC-2 type transport system ATP-binding protein